MGSGSKDKKKKPYLSPIFTKLTPQQAKKLVADRTGRNDQEAAEFLQSFRQEHAPGGRETPAQRRQE